MSQTHAAQERAERTRREEIVEHARIIFNSIIGERLVLCDMRQLQQTAENSIIAAQVFRDMSLNFIFPPPPEVPKEVPVEQASE